MVFFGGWIPKYFRIWNAQTGCLGWRKLNPFSRLEKPKTVGFPAMKNQKLWVFALISCSCPLFFANFASSSATSVRSAWQWWVRCWKWRAPKTASNGTRAARTQNQWTLLEEKRWHSHSATNLVAHTANLPLWLRIWNLTPTSLTLTTKRPLFWQG